ncbi:MAG: hypothetical protein HY361_02905 [Candidatus Aenigmarchaeota archaeon]|nr:hypothetical protein [Candidatus Aenigmarchaeota archaeon]
MEETTVCKLCLEPVSNFICTDCLFSNVNKWLFLIQHQHLSPKILAKHNDIKSILRLDTDGAYCIKCKGNVGEIACPCCYLYEMYLIIKESSQELAGNFEKNFNYDFRMHHAYSQLTLWQSLHEESVSSRTFNPIIISERKILTDINICDNCGQISDMITESNGSHLCESCLEETRVELFRPFSIDFQ